MGYVAKKKIEKLILLRKYDLALKEIAHLIEQNPDDADAYHYLGCILSEKGEDIEAIQALQKALELSPENDRAHNALGGILLERGKLREAENHLLKALEIFPLDANYLANLGRVYFQKRDYLKAIEYSEAGLKLEPDNEFCLNNLVWIYIRQKRSARAQKLLEQTLKENPENIETLVTLGNTLLLKDEYSEAEKVFRSVLNLYPESEEAIIGFKEASSLNNSLGKILGSKRTEKWLSQIFTSLIILSGLMIYGFGVPYRVRWLLLLVLLQTFVLPALFNGFGKLIFYLREKRLRSGVSAIELGNAVLVVGLFFALMPAMFQLGIMLSSEQPFPMKLFLCSIYLILLQFPVGLRVNWFTRDFLLRRVFLISGFSLAVLSIFITNYWYIFLAAFILIHVFDFLYRSGRIFRRWAA